jgi:4-aminobutyrate aminotransferase/(S)-3-amino-2-methylpropionate transaminase
MTYPECALHCARHLEDTFKRIVAAESVAAIIVEPVLGEGGFIAPPLEWLGAVQDICRKHGIVLIADEVQTGFGRTGKMFACEHFGIEPDLILTAKSLGGGLPLAGVTGKAEIMDHVGPGALGGTFGGNPLACEAALAVLDAIEQGNLCDRAMQLGEQFRKRALAWKQRFAVVGDVRGLGAMQAMELVSEADGNTPNADATKGLTQYCLERGVILVTAGSCSNVIRILMPLVITNDQMNEALGVMEAGLAVLTAKESQPAAHHASVS